MGKRSKRRRVLQADARINQARRDISREQEVLFEHQPDDRTRALLAQLGTASEAEAVEIGLKLQQIVRGEASLLDNPEMSEQLSKVRGYAHERDEAARKWNEDQEKFKEEVYARADKLRPRGVKAAEAQARAAQITQQAYSNARVQTSQLNAEFDRLVEYGPKETISVAPKHETVRLGDNIETVQVPDIVRIRHREWRLWPGVYEVPKPVAERYRDILRSRAATAARKKAMTKGQRDVDMVQELARIAKEYKDGGPLPTAVGLV
jgi:hypothetical protein